LVALSSLLLLPELVRALLPLEEELALRQLLVVAAEELQTVDDTLLVAYPDVVLIPPVSWYMRKRKQVQVVGDRRSNPVVEVAVEDRPGIVAGRRRLEVDRSVAGRHSASSFVGSSRQRLPPLPRIDVGILLEDTSDDGMAVVVHPLTFE